MVLQEEFAEAFIGVCFSDVLVYGDQEGVIPCSCASVVVFDFYDVLDGYDLLGGKPVGLLVVDSFLS